MTMRIGVLPLARPTFDVPYAEEMAAKAFATLDSAGIQTVVGHANCSSTLRPRRPHWQRSPASGSISSCCSK